MYFCKDQITWTLCKHVIYAKEQAAKSKYSLVIFLNVFTKLNTEILNWTKSTYMDNKVTKHEVICSLIPIHNYNILITKLIYSQGP